MLDVAVIGCGIVGANVAYLLSQHKLRAAVFEKENDVSMGTTRANSAIVHAGYDPEPGTAMARLNVRGSALTKEQCAAFDVKYRQIGSLVLAFSDEEMATVRRLYENGVANGVPGVRVLTREETLAMEPNLSDAVCGALYAPSAAIVEPWDLALALAEAAVENGVELHLETAVTGAEKISGGWRLHTAKGDFEARAVVNAAGVEADELNNLVSAHKLRIVPRRGEYLLYDTDQGFAGSRTDRIWYNIKPGGTGTQNAFSTDLIYNLLKNDKFRTLFVERLENNMKNVWNTERVLARIDEFYNRYKPEVARNFQRWNPYTLVWENEVEAFRVFARNRQKYIKKELSTDPVASVFKLSAEEIDRIFE